MADRPILFSGPMVRALLDGRKTQTRRVLCHYVADAEPPYIAPYAEGARAVMAGPDGAARTFTGARGATVRDRLWVREACALPRPGVPHLLYRADHDDAVGVKWRPSIHMPRTVSRLTLTVTEVLVQRLWDISEADAKAEGVPAPPEGINPETAHYDSYRDVFADLWESLNADRAPWASNPWVCAISFTVQCRNISQTKVSA